MEQAEFQSVAAAKRGRFCRRGSRQEGAVLQAQEEQGHASSFAGYCGFSFGETLVSKLPIRSTIAIYITTSSNILL